MYVADDFCVLLKDLSMILIEPIFFQTLLIAKHYYNNVICIAPFETIVIHI